MRSLLSCLEVAYRDEPLLVVRVQHAWSGLSRACHQHAFELAPTATEVEQLIDVVRTVVMTPGVVEQDV